MLFSPSLGGYTTGIKFQTLFNTRNYKLFNSVYDMLRLRLRFNVTGAK